MLTALWHKAGSNKDGLTTPSQPEQYAVALAPLVGSLTTPEAREALSAALVALSGLLPDLATAARLLTGLSKRSEGTIGEPDYESTMVAYGEMTQEMWSGMKKMQGLLLMQQCFWDLRNPDDLALRHAAAQVSYLFAALLGFVPAPVKLLDTLSGFLAASKGVTVLSMKYAMVKLGT